MREAAPGDFVFDDAFVLRKTFHIYVYMHWEYIYANKYLYIANIPFGFAFVAVRVVFVAIIRTEIDRPSVKIYRLVLFSHLFALQLVL